MDLSIRLHQDVIIASLFSWKQEEDLTFEGFPSEMGEEKKHRCLYFLYATQHLPDIPEDTVLYLGEGCSGYFLFGFFF